MMLVKSLLPPECCSCPSPLVSCCYGVAAALLSPLILCDCKWLSGGALTLPMAADIALSGSWAGCRIFCCDHDLKLEEGYCSMLNFSCLLT